MLAYLARKFRRKNAKNMPGRTADGPDFCKISESRIENDTRLGQVPKGSNATNGKVGFAEQCG
ncbi:MAG: hypothetical protein GKR99_11215 [Rhodobacteraceae bacterium]|nr:hypothetical protein [Paracoccaceae bacterium]